MSIIKLRDWAADKRKFVKVRDYLDFAEAFVEFREKAGNIQAELVARNTPQYRFSSITLKLITLFPDLSIHSYSMRLTSS